MQRVALIIPAYNESTVIVDSLRQLNTFCSQHPSYDWQIVVVDDGSTDDTAELVSSVKDVILVRQKENFGKGAAIQAGVNAVDADIYGFIDADLSINYIETLMNVLSQLEKVDVVVGKRVDRKKGYSLLRRVGSYLFSFLSKRLYGIAQDDPQCGYKWFKKEVKDIVLAVEQNRFSFDTELLMRLEKERKCVVQQEVSWKHNKQSSVGMVDALRYMLDMFLVFESRYAGKKFLWFYVLAAVIVVSSLFGWLLWYGYFFSDDFTWLWHAKKILAGETTILTARMSSFYSPVLNAFYTWLYPVFGSVPAGYFAVGMLIHAATSFMVGVLTKLVTRSWFAGLLAVVLFAFAGGAYEPIVWIGANMHSIVALFITSSIAALIASYQYRKYSGLLLFISFVSAVLAFGTKEIAIILPAIVFLVLMHYRKKIFQPIRIIYILAFYFLSIAYAYQQYLWQKASVWVGDGVWSLEAVRLLKYPLVMLDAIIPLRPLLTADNALIYTVISFVLFSYVIYRFRSELSMWLGICWVALAALPVIFFETLHWWSLLASRYTYTMRVGIIMLIAGILVSLMRNAKTVRTAHAFFWVLIVLTIGQIAFMISTVTSEYAYVYQSGRSLNQSVEYIAELQPDKVYVLSGRPFEVNVAHIVAAFDLVADIKEDQVIFLNETDQIDDGVFLVWDSIDKKYIVK